MINLSHADHPDFSSYPHTPRNSEAQRELATYRVIAVVFAAALGLIFVLWALVAYMVRRE
jgi:hypothetical protein